MADDSSPEMARFAALLEALQCGALIVDRLGVIRFVNTRLCEMIHRPCENLKGLNLLELYPEGEGRQIIEESLRDFDAPREHEFYLPRPDGSELPVIISSRRLDCDSPLGDHRVVTVINFERQKKAERELQQRYTDISSLSDTVLQQAVELKRYSERLEQRVQERTAELHRANMDAIYMLAVASEAKDHDTGAHIRRIEHYTRLLAGELGFSELEADRLAYSSILHDVGKLHVPDDILQKPGPLSDDEWVTMRDHTTVGERMLSRESFFKLARDIARSHHENWDGSGYPDGLKGENISIAARIVHAVDVYDALTSARPYKEAWSASEAVAVIEKECGSAFDPAVVNAFLRLHNSGRLIAPSSGDK